MQDNYIVYYYIKGDKCIHSSVIKGKKNAGEIAKYYFKSYDGDITIVDIMNCKTMENELYELA